MENLEEIESFLAEATQEDTWGRLLYRGTAWAIMRQEGKLPDDAPPLGTTIETDLAEYGFAILRAALALKEQEGNSTLCQQAFEKSANAFESLVRNGSPKRLNAVSIVSLPVRRTTWPGFPLSPTLYLTNVISTPIMPHAKSRSFC